MLTTLAMVVVAVAVFIFARGGRRPLELDIDHARDPPGPRLLPGDVLARRGRRAAAQQAVRLRPRDRAHGGLRLLRAPALPGRRRGGREASDEIRTLYVWDWLRKLRSSLPAWTKDGPTAAPFVQVALALGLIVLGAEIFVGAVGDIGEGGRDPDARVLAAGRAARDRAPREVQQRALGAAAQGHPRDGEHDRGDGVPVVVPGDGRAAVHAVGAEPRGAGRRAGRAARRVGDVPDASDPRRAVRARCC